MENIKNQTESREQGVNKRLLFLAASLLVLVFIFVYILFFVKFDSEKPLSLPGEKQEQELEGEIYLTLSKLDVRSLPNIYRLDLKTAEIEEVFLSRGEQNYMARFSKSGDKMVFVKVYEFTPTTLVSQILIYDTKTGETTEVTPRDSLSLRDPKFSPDEQSVVYWAEDFPLDDLSQSLYAEDYSIYLTTLDGDAEQIAKGAYPLFSPNGESIIFLKNDGLYFMNLVNMREESFLSFADWGEFNWVDDIRFVISPSGESLLLTDTSSGTLRHYRILDWDNFTYEEEFAFDFLVPNWPVFSPDGKYFAVQDYESEKAGSSGVYIFDLENYDLKKTVSLEDYYHEGIWLTDWIY